MKKNITIAIMFAVSSMSFAQSLGYEDLGLLFSQNDNNGTARFTAMGGAFGALGGDISAININPAGLSVFKSSAFSGTFNSRSTNINTTYYGNSINSENEYINIPQAGAVLTFDTPSNSGEWNKFAIGFNYRITKDFNDNFSARGNSGVATFTEFPLDENDPKLVYDIADEQSFVNSYKGDLSEINIGFSAVHQRKLHVGLGLNFYSLNFSQRSTLSEFNSDSDGNLLDAFLYQESFITGSGFSANLGFIYKLHPNFRFGLSYQTPTWYNEILDENNILNNDGYNGDTEIMVSNSNEIYDNTIDNFPYQIYAYSLKTPSKLTASAALIFGKFGLLSLDYSNKYFNNIRFSDGDFSQENQSLQDNYRNTHNFNVGTEWRFNRLSLRGGYIFEQNPDKQALDSDNLEGYSLGGGYNFGNFKIDFSFADNNRTAPYNFYSGYNVDPAELSINNKVFTSTLTINL